jgi:undecaprenyl-diphosphatase
MSRIAQWLEYHEMQLFDWINQRIRHSFLDFILVRITHLGGATATLVLTSFLSLISSGSLRMASMQSFVAVIISHLPVVLLKKKYRRLRPYLVLPQARLCIHPLKDNSFPSGHTTAIFACVLPFMISSPIIALVLLPLAMIVGYSRIYIGLHFPFDCFIGAVLGTFTSVCVVSFWN